nr:MAG TPA: distal tail protein [Caudoviricetes sp.]
MADSTHNDIRFIFCGMDSYDDLGIIVNDIHRFIGPNVEENLQTVPGMYGQVFQGNSWEEREFDIDITIPANSEAERVEKIHNMADLFIQTAFGEFPMVFDDDSDFTYYGHFTTLPEPARVAANSNNSDETATLVFMCSDPMAYGLQQTITIDKNPFTFTPDGGAECYPVFTCIPHGDVTKIAVSDQDGNYVYVGEDVDPDNNSQPIDNEPRKVWDYCNTFGTGWTSFNQSSSTTITNKPLPFNSENDKVPSNASMESTVETFDVKSFGTNPKDCWYGPMIQRSFPAAYSNWRISVRMNNYQYDSRVRGKIELYLLDSSSKRIGLFSLKDNGNGEDVWAIIEIGDHDPKKDMRHKMIQTQGTIHNAKAGYVKLKTKSGTKKVKVKGKTKTETVYKTIKLPVDPDTDSFTHFFGTFTLEKNGNKYTASIMKNDTKTHAPVWSKPFSATFTDTDNKYDNALAGVALFIGKWGIYQDDHGISYTNNKMSLTDLKVYEIQNGGNSATSSPSVIAHSGDEIKIDCEQDQVFKNGNLFMQNLFIGSNFITMKGGTLSTFGLEPDIKDADWTLDYLPTHR